MMGRTHGLVGLTIGATVASAVHAPVLVAACAGAGFLGSLLPDLDEPGSMISNLPWIFVLRPLLSLFADEPVAASIVAVVGFPVVMISIALQIVLQGASALTGALSGGHREATHTLWAWLLVSALATAAFFVGHAPWLVCWAASAGYASHLLTDGCTLMGLPWRRTRTHVVPAGMWIRTGGSAENAFVLLYGALVVLAWATLLHAQSQQAFAALTLQGQMIASQGQALIAHTVLVWWPHLPAKGHS